MVLIPTDLPEPVVPAISKWGMVERSATTGSPPIFLPKARASFDEVFSYSGAAKSSRKNTVSRWELGNSIPITLRPGTTATRADTALMERAISSASPITREDLMPAAGSSS